MRCENINVTYTCLLQNCICTLSTPLSSILHENKNGVANICRQLECYCQRILKCCHCWDEYGEQTRWKPAVVAKEGLAHRNTMRRSHWYNHSTTGGLGMAANLAYLLAMAVQGCPTLAVKSCFLRHLAYECNFPIGIETGRVAAVVHQACSSQSRFASIWI